MNGEYDNPREHFGTETGPLVDEALVALRRLAVEHNMQHHIDAVEDWVNATAMVRSGLRTSRKRLNEVEGALGVYACAFTSPRALVRAARAVEQILKEEEYDERP